MSMPLSAEISQPRIADLLRRAVARGNVPQSVIFAGPEGAGKRAMAVALAQAVNCPSQTDGDACGTCSTCTRIARGDHYDVVTVTREDNAATIKIEQIRDQVLGVVGYRPFEARRRVFIIDPADAITDAGQDALLKTLEEPPPAAMILLLTGMQAIPLELYEAARVDGASYLGRLRYITMPLLRRTFALALILSVIGSYLGFDQFFIMTAGGPQNSTISVVYWIYKNSFTNFKLGYGASMSIVLLVVLVILSVIQLRLLRDETSY